MKSSNAIVRALLVFVAVTVIQAVAGTLVLAPAKPLPHAMLWTLLSNALVVAALSLVAVRSEWRGWRLGAVLAGIPLAISCVNFIEGVVFLTNSGINWPRLLLFLTVSAALVMPVWMLLFGRRPDVSQPHYHPIAAQSRGERAWKFVLSDFAYVFLYLTAGMIIFPYVKDFYATQHLPSMGALLALQFLLRGPLFIALCLGMVRMLGLPRLSGALAVGAVFTILSGVAPLIMPNQFFPDAVRWVHLCEVTSSNFVFAAIVGWLWGQRDLAPAQVLRHAA
jgi:hypothetical protein